MSDNLEETVTQAWQTQRPIAHRLGEASCWLWSFPLAQPGPSGRHWFHLMLDAWFTGEVKQLRGWLYRQAYKGSSAYAKFGDIEELVQRVEDIGAKVASHPPTTAKVDAIAFFLDFPDHMPPNLVRQIPKSTPALTTPLATATLRKMRHFDSVTEMDVFDPSDWRKTAPAVFPPHLSIGWVKGSIGLPQYWNSGIVLAFDDASVGDAREAQVQVERSIQAITYAPHGVNRSDLDHLFKNTSINMFAIMSGLRSTVTQGDKYLVLGAPGALENIRAFHPPYWLRNHDEQTSNGGLAFNWSYLYKDKWRTLDSALEEEAAAAKKEGQALYNGLEGTKFVDLQPGTSAVLV